MGGRPGPTNACLKRHRRPFSAKVACSPKPDPGVMRAFGPAEARRAARPLPLSKLIPRRSLQRSSCFVLPCIQAKDGSIDALPTALLEALAWGCPTVSTRLGGVPEIVENEVSGVLIEPGDDKGLARAIGSVLTDPNLATSPARAGRRRAAERFDKRRGRGIRSWP